MSEREGSRYFAVEAFSQLAAAESANWWFRSRNRLILWALQSYCGKFESFLEIGCGTGFVLEGVRKKYAEARLFGSEFFEEGLSFARSRVPSAAFFRLDAKDMADVGAFDVIGAFDVLEHIDDDRKVLHNIFNATKDGGFLVVTVPQHPRLWSAVDEYACHVRRYTRPELVKKIAEAGFEIVYASSFVSLLLPAMWVSRFTARNKSDDPLAELRIPRWLNQLFEGIMNVERKLMCWGLRLPAGGSLLVVGRKHDSLQ